MTALHSALRLTPANSLHFRSPSPRSPTKAARSEEPCLQLTKVIGTTTASANAFDALPSHRKFAFTAGAAAVVATINEDLSVQQDFFRANPTATAGPNTNGWRDWPASPSPHENRPRLANPVKDGVSPVVSHTRDWADSPTGKTLSAKDRVKAATSVALSPNGRWLAVGETGYKPRILIFALRDGSSEQPVCIISEHTFGVHALRFSGDSRFLASLGTVNDGFLFLWKIDDRTGAATIHASNKCTSIVHSMAWLDKCVVTAGLRFVKVWRSDDDATIDARESSRGGLGTPRQKNEVRQSDFGNSILSPTHRVLGGKNCLLGDLLEATFVSVTAISGSKALLCAASGEICVLDDNDKVQSLRLAAHAGIRITAARIDEHEMFHVYGEGGLAASFLIPDLQRRCAEDLPRRSSTTPSKLPYGGGSSVVAIATIAQAVVEIDSRRTIKLFGSETSPIRGTVAAPHTLPAHHDAVLGVRAMTSSVLQDASFLTYSSDGTVRFWNKDGNPATEAIVVPLEDTSEMHGFPNEMKSIAIVSEGHALVSGDKHGSLALLDLQSRSVMQRVRAHSAEILDILVFERRGTHFLATASRDRTVQLFMYKSGQLDLIQTMDEHAGAVTGLAMSASGNQLLSCSADRSVVLREVFQRSPTDPSTLAFVMVRAITLKATPTSLCTTSQPDVILVSSVDRTIGKYSTQTGQAEFSFKCTDNEGGEAVVMSKICFAPAFVNGQPAIAGVSSTDKSVRLYTEYGTLIARDWGHTEGVTDLALLTPQEPPDGRLDPQPLQIVTAAADSTVFLWESTAVPSRFSTQPSDYFNGDETLTPTTLRPPLRKVISHSEISRFRRDRSTDEPLSSSSSALGTPSGPKSPPKVRKKSSRLSMAPTPRLEPGPRSNFDPSRRRSLWQRSPSPPSPRNKNEQNRETRLGMSLRSKSSENVLGSNANSMNVGFGSLTSLTESACRTLRSYRKKLANGTNNDTVTPDALRELEKELQLTAQSLSERFQGSNAEEAMMERLLNRASDKMAVLFDERIKARMASGGYGNGEDSPSTPPQAMDSQGSPIREQLGRSDTAPGALQARTVEG